jgi:hypothetical protein
MGHEAVIKECESATPGRRELEGEIEGIGQWKQSGVRQEVVR